MSCFLHVGVAAAIAIWYDTSLHLFGRKYPRNHPATILRRFATVTVNCIGIVFVVHKMFQQLRPSYTLEDTLLDVGLIFNSKYAKLVVSSAVTGFGCTCLLYLGELLLLFLAGELKKPFTLHHWTSSLTSLVCWRDIVVGPISEEIAFRGCLISLLSHGCGGSQTFSVLLSSALFGVAHLHHIIEMLFFQGYSLSYSLQTIGFQIGYSTVFGMYASFLYIRTGHLAGPILAHSLCNWLGIPRLVIDVDEYNISSQNVIYRFLFNLAEKNLMFVYVLGLLMFFVSISFVNTNF